ncbi:MAG: multicopper oxidase domain-containing protein, partial [Planctomycetota bacterium]
MNIKKKKNSFFRPSLFQLEDRLTPSAYVEPNLITSNPATHVLDITLTAHASTQNLEVFTSPLVFTDASNGTSNSPANPPLGTTTKAVDGFLTYSWKINEGFNSVYNLTTSKYDPSGVLMGDSYPGPTLKVNRGDTLRITLLNGLEDLGGLKIIAVPSDTSSSLLKGQVRNPNENIQSLSKTDPLLLPNLITEMPLNNHVHGLHVSPTGSSDNVLLTIPASQGFVYEYKIPQNQPDGLYWMHPHNHEYSNPEVYRGLSNMLIIGESDSSINWGANIPERTMSLQYQLLAVDTNTNQYIQKSNGNYSLQDYTNQGDPGQQLTINGLLNPTITVQPGQTEVWTIANMTPQANMNFTLGNNVTYAYDGKNIVPVGNQQIIVVAQDGIPYSTPKIIPAGQFLNLPAGGRVSILVTAPSTGSL